MMMKKKKGEDDGEGFRSMMEKKMAKQRELVLAGEGVGYCKSSQDASASVSYW